MKDLRKTKNKYLFEFNNKQMALIFTGLLVIGLLVFAAGAMVGSRMAQSKIETEPKKDFSAKIKAPSLLKEKAEAKKGASPSSIEDVIKQTASKSQGIPPVKKEEADKPVSNAVKPQKGDATVAKVKKEPVKKQVTTEKSGKTKGYFVQVAAFRDMKDAKKRVEDLSKKGYKAIVVTAEIPEKGTWHRVRFGPFENLEKSKSFALNLEKKERISTFITSN